MPDLFDNAFNERVNREPLHPVVQMRFGAVAGKRISVDSSIDAEDSFILTIPPEYLVEFTYVSRRGGGDRMTLVLLDPTYGDLEAQLFKIEKESVNADSKAQKNQKALLIRWGYPGDGLEEAKWYTFQILAIEPSIDHTGIRLSIEAAAFGSRAATIAEPTVYLGKISDVAQSIASEMGYTPTTWFIEETDDEENRTRKTPWFSGNRTRIDILNDLVLQARSKVNPQGNYSFRLGADGTFHFHTSLFKKQKQAVYNNAQPQKLATQGNNNKRTYRRFNVLFGIPNGVKSFQPRYTAHNVGTYAEQCVASTVDPRTKQFQQRTIDRRTTGLSTDHDSKSAKTQAPPLNRNADGVARKPKGTNLTPDEQRKLDLIARRKSNTFAMVPTKSVGIGGRCAGSTTQQHTSPDQALTRVENAWKALQRALNGCTLTLDGLPEYADMTVSEDYIDVAVTLPPNARNVGGVGSFQVSSFGAVQAARPSSQVVSHGGIHWSSGRYGIREITHSITTGYIITVDCDRVTVLEGPAEAKTGPRQQKAPSKTISTDIDEVVDLLAPPTDTNVTSVNDSGDDPLSGTDI